MEVLYLAITIFEFVSVDVQVVFLVKGFSIALNCCMRAYIFVSKSLQLLSVVWFKICLNVYHVCLHRKQHTRCVCLFLEFYESMTVAYYKYNASPAVAENELDVTLSEIYFI